MRLKTNFALYKQERIYTNEACDRIASRVRPMEHIDFLGALILLYGLATLIAYWMGKARQPTIVGYLLTGVVAGPFGVGLISQTAAVEVLAEVGVALLL
jgi:CPA2 family monovalent cation:H+ antiporter-2